jgi:uncharacterized protein YmfQ (DUF2313 family)
MSIQAQIKQSLLNHLLSGSAWNGVKSDSTNGLNLFIGGLTPEFERIDELIRLLAIELNVLTTEELISKWEADFGIPDDCFSTTGLTIEQRILQVQIKHLMNGADRPDSWEYIASLLGFDVDVYPDELNYNVIIVEFLDDTVDPGKFEYTFPITFTASSGTNVLECIFDKIKPADSVVDYIYKV